MAFRLPIPASNSDSTYSGHLFQQTPQPVQVFSFTRRAFFRISTSKLPTKPFTDCTSEYDIRRIFGCWATSTILGVRIQEEQSRVGNVLSSCAMRPPMVGSR